MRMAGLPLTQVEIMCPIDGGDLFIERSPKGPTLRCVRCRAEYDFTPELKRMFELQKTMMRGFA